MPWALCYSLFYWARFSPLLFRSICHDHRLCFLLSACQFRSEIGLGVPEPQHLMLDLQHVCIHAGIARNVQRCPWCFTGSTLGAGLLSPKCSDYSGSATLALHRYWPWNGTSPVLPHPGTKRTGLLQVAVNSRTTLLARNLKVRSLRPCKVNTQSSVDGDNCGATAGKRRVKTAHRLWH
jgi:hypothetical protein